MVMTLCRALTIDPWAERQIPYIIIYITVETWIEKSLFYTFSSLTLNLLNFLNGIIHLPFLDLSIIIFKDTKMRSWSWSTNSIEHGQNARMCRLAWLYTGGKSWSVLTFNLLNFFNRLVHLFWKSSLSILAKSYWEFEVGISWKC